MEQFADDSDDEDSGTLTPAQRAALKRVPSGRGGRPGAPSEPADLPVQTVAVDDPSQVTPVPLTGGDTAVVPAGKAGAAGGKAAAARAEPPAEWAHEVPQYLPIGAKPGRAHAYEPVVLLPPGGVAPAAAAAAGATRVTQVVRFIRLIYIYLYIYIGGGRSPRL